MKKVIFACILATFWISASFASDPSDATGASGQPSADSKATSSAATPADAAKPFEIKVKPSGTFYLSYQGGDQYAGTANQTTNFSSFLIKRGYFGADVDITPYLTARFTSDVTVDSTGDEKLRAKYVYAKFHWKGDKTITEPYVEFGLIHVPWLDYEEAINGFRMQDTMFLERNNVINGADFGVMAGSDLGGSMSDDYKKDVNSKYAGRYGSWQIGVYNGGGYHPVAENNTNKVFEGRLSIRPVPGGAPGLQFTVFGVYGKGNVATTAAGIQPPDWTSLAGMISYESKFFTFTGQGYSGTGNQAGSALLSDKITAADQKGFSVFASVHIPLPKAGTKISLIGRMDEFNSNTSAYTDIKHLYIAGIAYHMYKSNILLFDFQRTNHSIATIPGENRAQITLQTVF